LVSDNGDITDYREVSELAPVVFEVRGDRQNCEVPVTARGGRTLSPDYTGTMQFSAFVEQMACECVPLCLVSHHKDLLGAFYDSHTRNVLMVRHFGYYFARLRMEIALEIASSYEPAPPRWSATSLELLRRVSRHGRLRCDARTPFPAWVLREIVRWQGGAAAAVSTEPITSLSLSRGVVLGGFLIRGRAPELSVLLGPRWVDLVPRLKYLLRRWIFRTPLWFRDLVRRFRAGSGGALAGELDLFRFFAHGPSR
jgi:hypothetical protein